jgi:hypothetical protein
MATKTKVRRRALRKGKGARLRRGPAAGAMAARGAAKAREAGSMLIGGAMDPAEKAADRMAAQALSSGPVAASPAPAAGGLHRMCKDCESEEKAKRSATPAPTVAPGARAAAPSPAASAAVASLGPGRPLARAERSFFEPRFGHDFSGVRLHECAAADRAARGIDASAFAWGNDIAFARGARPAGGARLMAHELAHVAQGGGSARQAVRRATIATSDGPKAYKKVPDDHRATVQKALDLVENAIKAKKCKDFFKDKCTAGVADSAESTFKVNTVYYLADRTTRFGLSDIRKVAGDPHIVAYNQQAFEIGRWEIAATLLHEMFHTCDMSVDDMDEILAEQATEACGFYAPWILSVTPTSLDVGDVITLEGYQLGQTQDADHYVEMGGVKIASYDTWEQAKGASSVAVEFKVPKAVNHNLFFSKDVELKAVNHGHDSNIRTVNVDP